MRGGAERWGRRCKRNSKRREEREGRWQKKKRALLVNSTRQSRRENFSADRELLKPGGLSHSPLCLPLRATKVTERMNDLYENIMPRGGKKSL